MSDTGPKSAYELAMERLRKKDADAGIVSTPLTDSQKEEIAEIRRVADARVAELKILHESAMVRAIDPETIRTLELEHRRDVERVEEDRERKIAAVRERGR
jgi:hypothetical protein